jgi:asparagine synthase (glutamine-hydrolysing)
MMSLQIDPSDIAGPWRFEDGAWSSGTSFVRPFEHSAVESLAVETAEATLIVVRENPRPGANGARRQASPDSSSAECLARNVAWPFNVQVLGLARSGRGLAIAAGEAATAPLFLVAEAGRLFGDWDVAKLYPNIRRGRLSFARAAYTLCHLGLPYSRQTLFTGVEQLTERARAQWDPAAGTLDLHYPEAASRPAPRQLKPDADVVGSFETLFAAIVRRAVGDSREALACELSGGLDSGVATLICARALGRDKVRSFGLLLPGEQQRSQAARRDSIVETLGIADRALPAAAPFSRGDLAEADPAIPWGEYYREAFLDLGLEIASAGCSRVVRGIGGDEISELCADEEEPAADAPAGTWPVRPLPDYLTDSARQAAEAAPEAFEWAPQGFAPTSFYQAAAASAPAYLRRGIWPIYPYGTPELIGFCRSLPKEWRIDRNLQRTYIGLAGLPDWVRRPDPPESFHPLRDEMFGGASARHLRSIFAAPILAELGLVDSGRLMAAFERAAADPDSPDRTQLLEAATMETMLRTWRRASEPLGP